MKPYQSVEDYVARHEPCWMQRTRVFDYATGTYVPDKSYANPDLARDFKRMARGIVFPCTHLQVLQHVIPKLWRAYRRNDDSNAITWLLGEHMPSCQYLDAVSEVIDANIMTEPKKVILKVLFEKAGIALR